MRPALAPALALALLAAPGCTSPRAAPVRAVPPMVVVSEADVVVREAPPHGAIGMSTAYRISDAAPQPRISDLISGTERTTSAAIMAAKSLPPNSPRCV